MLQIRRSKRDNLRFIFHITPLNICCDPSLESSLQDGSNEGSQHIVSFRNKKNYLQIILNTPLIWSSGTGKKIGITLIVRVFVCIAAERGSAYSRLKT